MLFNLFNDPPTHSIYPTNNQFLQKERATICFNLISPIFVEIEKEYKLYGKIL